MDAGHLVVAPGMVDRMYLGRIGVDAARLVVDDGVVVPALFPQLVDDVEVFVGQVVALVVTQLLLKPRLRAALSR
jgi:hypothetical protein